MKRWQISFGQGPPPLIWTKSKRTAIFLHETFPYICDKKAKRGQNKPKLSRKVHHHQLWQLWQIWAMCVIILNNPISFLVFSQCAMWYPKLIPLFPSFSLLKYQTFSMFSNPSKIYSLFLCIVPRHLKGFKKIFVNWILLKFFIQCKIFFWTI